MKNRATKFFQDYFKLADEDVQSCMYDDTVECMCGFVDMVSQAEIKFQKDAFEETALDWFYSKILPEFENDTDKLSSMMFTFSIAKIKEWQYNKNVLKSLVEKHDLSKVSYAELKSELIRRTNNAEITRIESHNQQLENETDAAGNCFSDADCGL